MCDTALAAVTASWVGLVLSLLCGNSPAQVPANVPAKLAGTDPLTLEGDIAARLVTAVDQFLMDQLRDTRAARTRHWQRHLASSEEYEASMKHHRQWLADRLGMREERPVGHGLELISTPEHSAVVGRGDGYEVLRVRWPAFADVYGEGLLLEPAIEKPVANIIALPHCDFSPEQACGLSPGIAADSQYARRLAEAGCRVVIPALIDRRATVRGISHREWLHRAAYEMGRTLTGYEVTSILAVVDWFERSGVAPVGVIGWGDGGLLAWHATAIDTRIDGLCISGAFGDLEQLWRQPLDRMVFGFLERFGDAELAALVAPRPMVIETGTAPVRQQPPQSGSNGAPYEIHQPDHDTVSQAGERARRLAEGFAQDTWLTIVSSERAGSTEALTAFLQSLSPGCRLPPSNPLPRSMRRDTGGSDRHIRMMHRFDRHTQMLLRDCHWVRQKQFWDRLDTSSLDAYEASIAPFRQAFYDDVIGRFNLPLSPPRPRSRGMADAPAWTRYEVVLDVFPGVFAYGILTMPKGLAPGERRPVVVCQHGLEGRPQSVIGQRNYDSYKAFATRLAERGFVTFAPQNLYIFGDRFRTLQRKANCLGKTLFSIITPQHQQIVNWLKRQPFVDPNRVAFYGLSYGGKTAMRVPPLVTDYCLSICSADFNEWVDKNASTRNPRSYLRTGEYEIFEWDLGHRFNYAEMAALIAPRPFMVERGHFDGVADDWTVAWEYARVRYLYAALLGIPQRTEIEWFSGPHTINGEGTFDFLHRHLDWPLPKRDAP